MNKPPRFSLSGSWFGLAGGRELSRAFAPLVARVVAGLASEGRALAVGCARGADRLALAAALEVSAPVRVFAVASAPAEDPRLAALAPGLVSWGAGGSPALPARARLACRTKALVAALPAGSPFVAFFARPDSVGTLLAASSAAARGLPVFAFPCGFPGPRLPLLGPGAWAEVMSSDPLAGAWRWCPAQSSLWPSGGAA